MADLNDKESSQTVKLVGADASSGTETNFLEVDSDGQQTVKLADANGDTITSTLDTGRQALDVNVINSLTTSSGAPDKTAFTYGTTSQQTVGGVYQDTSPGLTAGQEGAVRLTQNRSFHINLRDDAGTEIATSSNPLRIDPTGSTTQPISAASLPLPTGAATESTLSTLNSKVPSNLTVSSTRLLVDGSGVTQPISAASLPLPTGASTSALQTTANSSLSSIDTKIPANLTVSSTRLLVDGSGVTQPISAASLPLPTGAATETTLSAINTKTPTLGQTTMSGSQPVAIASNQSAIPVSQSGTWNITNISGTVSLPTGAATSANQTTQITSLQLIDDIPHSQNATFNKGIPMMGQLDDTATTAATEDNIAAVRITAQRAQHINLRNNSGAEIGISGSPIRTDPTGTTNQPVLLKDSAGNGITSSLNGSKQSLDVNVSGGAGTATYLDEAIITLGSDKAQLILGLDRTSTKARMLSVTADGRIKIATEPPSAPGGATAIDQVSDSTVSTVTDTTYTITNGKTLTIQNFNGGGAAAVGGDTIELYYDPNGTGTGMTLIRVAFIPDTGGNFSFDLKANFTGNGTRRILTRRTRNSGGSARIAAFWAGYEE